MGLTANLDPTEKENVPKQKQVQIHILLNAADLLTPYRRFQQIGCVIMDMELYLLLYTE